MLNPYDALLKEFRKMNEGLIERLDKIIEQLELLVDLESDHG
jgi:hypothetical protein